MSAVKPVRDPKMDAYEGLIKLVLQARDRNSLKKTVEEIEALLNKVQEQQVNAVPELLNFIPRFGIDDNINYAVFRSDIKGGVLKPPYPAWVEDNPPPANRAALLFRAAMVNSPEIVELFLDRGADPKIFAADEWLWATFGSGRSVHKWQLSADEIARGLQILRALVINGCDLEHPQLSDILTDYAPFAEQINITIQNAMKERKQIPEQSFDEFMELTGGSKTQADYGSIAKGYSPSQPGSPPFGPPSGPTTPQPDSPAAEPPSSPSAPKTS